MIELLKRLDKKDIYICDYMYCFYYIASLARFKNAGLYVRNNSV